MHGLGGFKEQPQTRAVADVLHEGGYTVVTFDTTNTFSESEGRYEEATTTNYYEDLEDVIAWVTTEPWPPPLRGGAPPLSGGEFVLVGFSLGGLCVALYAEKHPEKVKALALIGTVVSGKLRMENPYRKEENDKWERAGWREEESASNPGMIKRLPWSHMEDCLKYDLLAPVTPSESPPPRGGETQAISSPAGGEVRRGGSNGGGRMTDRLTMPVLLAIGEKDESCPPEHQRIFYDALPGPKELHIIPGAPHTFREPDHLKELRRKLNRWLMQIVKKVP